MNVSSEFNLSNSAIDVITRQMFTLARDLSNQLEGESATRCID